MKRYIIFLIIGVFSLPHITSAAQVISDSELDKVVGQTGIVLSVVLDTLIGEDYDTMTDEEKAKIVQLLKETFGPLSLQEVGEFIYTQQLFDEILQNIDEEDRKHIEEAYEIITDELLATTPADLLQMTGGGQITADVLDDWAQEKLNKILIAQQIINEMIKALSLEEQQQMMNVQEIVNIHFNALKR